MVKIAKEHSKLGGHDFDNDLDLSTINKIKCNLRLLILTRNEKVALCTTEDKWYVKN